MEQTPQADEHSSSFRPHRSVGPPMNPESYPRTGYAWFVVGLLTLAYVFSFIDRQILNLMVGPIKRDLGIDDRQMGLLMGASFAVFYTFFGIPLGRLADTRSRRVLIAIPASPLWSLMTCAGCEFATRKFWQLALMRMGVGVGGNASLSPAAYSLIADYFRPELRSTAISVYLDRNLYRVRSRIHPRWPGRAPSRRPRGVLLAVGGRPVRSWQLVFFLVGLPGLLVALLMLLIREPSRKGHGGSQSAPMSAVWSYFRDNWSSVLCLNLGVAMITLFGYGAFAWNSEFLMRRFGWKPGQTGLVFGLIVAFGGTLGICIRRAAGRLAAKPRLLRRRREGGAAGRACGHTVRHRIPAGFDCRGVGNAHRSRDLFLQRPLQLWHQPRSNK